MIQLSARPPNTETLRALPAWITAENPDTSEDLAFLSGAALSHLDMVLKQGQIPLDLLRARLALKAAVLCVAHARRTEQVSDLRDVLAFLKPGDHPGPAGDIALSWRSGITRKPSIQAVKRALPGRDPEDIAKHLKAARVSPVLAAANTLQGWLEANPRDATAACLLAETRLSTALHWPFVVPVLTLGLKPTDLNRRHQNWVALCHRAIWRASAEVLQMAIDLGRRAEMLQAVTPKLRAKGADQAVHLFLTRDAITPSLLSAHLRSERAARRFCDRLVALGVARELSGRDTFRLYGL